MTRSEPSRRGFELSRGVARGVLWGAACAAALVVAGCGDDGGPAPERAPVEGTTPEPSPWGEAVPAIPVELGEPEARPLDVEEVVDWDAMPVGTQRWMPCATPEMAGEVERQGQEPECGYVVVPLDWDAPDGGRIALHMKRWPALGARRGQVWLLQGGPGEPGVGLDDVARTFQARLAGLDVMVPDHRGTGRSSWLGCSGASESLSSACLDALEGSFGDGIAALFSTTAAAHDLGFAIDQTAREGDEVLMWSLSYGTFLANRYLHLYPDQISALVMDSPCSPSGCPAVDWDRNMDRVGRSWLEMCGEDAVCRDKVGDDPVALLEELHAVLDRGFCPDVQQLGLDREGLKSLFSMWITSETFRPFIPAVMYRLNRCDPDDIEAFYHLMTLFGGMLDPQDNAQPGAGSMVLYANITYSEFWRSAPSAQTLADVHAELLFSRGHSMHLASVFEGWPWLAYGRAEQLEGWAQTDLPVLVLGGTMDPQTPVHDVQHAEAHFDSPVQHVVWLPYATHVAFAYQRAIPDDPTSTCGMGLTLAFLNNPERALDVSCVDAIEPPRFTADVALVEHLFHEPDLWEHTVPLRAAPEDEDTSKLRPERLVERLGAHEPLGRMRKTPERPR